MIIHELTNTGSNLIRAAYKIILNFRERPNGALLSSEITLSDTGIVMQWVSQLKVIIHIKH